MASNDLKDPKVTIKNVVIYGRAFPEEPNLYNSESECRTDGIQLSVFSKGQFDYDFKNLSLPLYKPISHDLVPGNQFFDDLEFFNFDSTECEGTTEKYSSYPIVANNYYNNTPIIIYFNSEQVLFDIIHFDPTEKVNDSETSEGSPSTEVTRLTGIKLQDDPNYPTYQKYLFKPSLLGVEDPDCQRKSVNIFECKREYGQMKLTMENPDSNLYPYEVKGIDPETGETLYTRVVSQGSALLSNFLYGIVNRISFNTELQTNITFNLHQIYTEHYMILEMNINRFLMITVLDKTIPKTPKSSLTNKTPNSSLQSCGDFSLTQNQMSLYLDSAPTCVVSVKFTKGLKSSIQTELNLSTLEPNDGLFKIERFLYKTLEIPLEPPRIALSFGNNERIVFFSIEVSEDTQNEEYELRRLFCKLQYKIHTTEDIFGVKISPRLGKPTFYLGKEESFFFEDPCDIYLTTNPFCNIFNHETSQCKECRPGFSKGSESDECFPTNCKRINEDTNSCQECASLFWLDTTDYSSCKQVTLVDFCREYSKQSDHCRTCENGKILENNVCVEHAQGVKNCNQYDDSNGACIKCENDFYVNQNSCVPYSTGLNCKTFHSRADRCTECSDHFVFKNGKCVDNAIYTDSEFSSESCAEGFYLDLQTRKCLSKSIPNCKVYVRNQDLCEACDPFHSLSKTKSKCEPIKGCRLFNAERDKCERCARNLYFLESSRGVCVPRANTKCRQFELELDQCILCQSGHYLEETTSKCLPVSEVEGCAEYEHHENNCKYCVTSMYFDGGDCKDILSEINNCLYYNEQSKCAVCQDEYFLESPSSCQQGDLDDCLEYASENQCKKCKKNFFLDSTQECRPYSINLNCDEFHPTQDQCLTCPYNYKWTPTYSCEKLSFCKDHEPLDPSTCRECEPDYYLDRPRNQCLKRNKKNCKTTEVDQDKCFTCKDNFKMNQKTNNCEPPSRVANCISYDIDTNTCLDCNSISFYDKEEEKCRIVNSPVEHCFVYEGDGACGICKSNYVRHKPQECAIGDISGCKTYAGISECWECYPGYFLEAPDNCQRYTHDLNCKVFDPASDKCQTCYNRQTLDGQSKKCVQIKDCEDFAYNQKDCVKCQDSYYLNDSQKKCFPRTQKNCESHEPLRDECKTCIWGYYKDVSNSGSCLKHTDVLYCEFYSEEEDSCAVCKPDYYLEYNECQSVEKENMIENCAYYSSRKVCGKCFDTYYKKGDECSTGEIPHCAQYENVDTCKTCTEGYYLQDKECVLHSPDLNCDQYDNKSDACLSCPEKHQPNGNKCVQIEHCAEFNKDTRSCETCEKSFFLEDETQLCQHRKNKSCKFFHPSLDQCELCFEGQYLSKEDNYQCLFRTLKSEECVEFDFFKDRCLECAEDWILAEGTCLSPSLSVDHCDKYSRYGDCLECESGFFKEDGKCISENCAIHKNGKCTKCESGYFLKLDASEGTAPGVVDDKCYKHSFHSNCSEPNPNKDECEVCSQNYVHNENNECVHKSKLHCTIFEESNKSCIVCMKGYFDVNGVCTQNPCAGHGDSITPTSCQEGYEFDCATAQCVQLEVKEQNTKTTQLDPKLVRFLECLSLSDEVLTADSECFKSKGVSHNLDCSASRYLMFVFLGLFVCCLASTVFLLVMVLKCCCFADKNSQKFEELQQLSVLSRLSKVIRSEENLHRTEPIRTMDNSQIIFSSKDSLPPTRDPRSVYSRHAFSRVTSQPSPVQSIFETQGAGLEREKIQESKSEEVKDVRGEVKKDE